MRKEERSHDIAKRKYKATTCCVYLYKLDYNNITTATRSLGTSESEFNSRQIKGPMQEKRPMFVLCECASQKRNDHMLYDDKKFQKLAQILQIYKNRTISQSQKTQTKQRTTNTTRNTHTSNASEAVEAPRRRCKCSTVPWTPP